MWNMQDAPRPPWLFVIVVGVTFLGFVSVINIAKQPQKSTKCISLEISRRQEQKRQLQLQAEIRKIYRK